MSMGMLGIKHGAAAFKSAIANPAEPSVYEIISITEYGGFI